MEKVTKLKDCGERIGILDDNIYNAIIIPDNATNGDMIQNMFPNIKVEYIKKLSGMNYYEVSGMDAFGSTKTFYEDWWNAPYKENCIPSEYDLSEDIELNNPQMYR